MRRRLGGSWLLKRKKKNERKGGRERKWEGHGRGEKWNDMTRMGMGEKKTNCVREKTKKTEEGKKKRGKPRTQRKKSLLRSSSQLNCAS